jgi:MFS transporter, Spinster family, sphingosine-1-phosphate transporter
MPHPDPGPTAAEPATVTAPAPTHVPTSTIARGAYFALVVLFSMNLLNYIDRYVFAAVGKAVMEDLQLRPGPFGVLGTSFMVVYTVVSPLVGWMGDRYSRRKILAFGVGLWSVATVGTAFAAGFNQMFLARALLGVGEASYGVIAPTLLADLFPLAARGRVMGLFYLALPVGTAIGYGVGGKVQALATDHADDIRRLAEGLGVAWLAPHLVGWRAAFWVVGLPGLLLALAGLFIHDPGRGASEGRKAMAGKADRPSLSDYLLLLRTPSFLLNTAGMAAVTFTIGAYGHWMPTYYQLVHNTKPEENLTIGAALAGAGILGVLIGMWLPDRLLRVTRRAYLLWAAVAVLAAIPFGAAGLLATDRTTSLALMFAASVLLTSCLGPCNTITANVVPANRRAVGYALSIFLLHLFGDIPSPPLIGEVADRLATPAARSTEFVQLFERIGARPIDPAPHVAAAGPIAGDPAHAPTGPVNLTAGMLLIIPVLVLGSLCFLLGSRTLPRDQDRAKAAGAGVEDDGVLIH